MKRVNKLKLRNKVGARAFLLCGAFFFAAALLGAKETPPDQVVVSTPSYTPGIDALEPNLGQYRYRASWNGVPAGTITLTLNRRGNDYHISTNAQTARVIDIFYKLRFHAEARVSAATFHPKRSLYVTRANSRRKKTQMTFLPGGEISSRRKGSSGDVRSYTFNPENLTLDPFSAAFLALSLNWEVGQTRRFDTFNGKSRYLIELTAVDKTHITVNGTRREAFVISPEVTDLTDSEPSNKLHGAKIYFAADSSREILRIVSDLFIGSIKAEMVSHTPPDSWKAN